MEGGERVIFHDQTKVRKRLFRAFIVFFFGALFLLAIAALFDLFGNLNSENKSLNTVRYYNYYYFGGNNEKKIALTFDDGPDSRYTRELLALLEKYDIPATFFFIGQEAIFHPALIKEVSDKGHEIGNHTFTHSHDVHENERRVQLELAITEYLLTVVTGKPPLFYRPPFLLDIGIDPTINPYISNNEALLRSVSYNYIPIGADIDSKDWKAKDTEEIIARIEDGARAGHIILLHDGGDHDISLMLRALPTVIERMREQGYTFVPLEELLIPDIAPPEAPLRFGDKDNSDFGEVARLQSFLGLEGYLGSEFTRGLFDEETAFGYFQWKIANKLASASSSPILQSATLDDVSLKRMNELSLNPETLRLEIDKVSVLEQISRWVARNLIFGFASIINLAFLILIIVTILIGLRLLFIFGLFIFQKRQKKLQQGLVYAGNVSVIIPAYNEAENIKATIESITHNSHKTDDIIVVDDGSKDGTADEVKKIIDHYPDKVKLIRKTNGGKASALNMGIASSKYEIVITLDGDAIFAPTAIEHLIAPFSEPSVGAVAGTVLTAEAKNFLDRFQRIEYITGQYLEKEALRFFGAIGVVPGPIGAWRKEAIKKAGGYSLSTVVEDQDMTFAVHAAGYKVVYQKEAIAYTETPFRVRDFLKQRFRWVFGTYQCFWKYKKYIGRKDSPPGFRYIILPNVALFGFILPIFFPIMDFLFLASLVFGPSIKFIIGFAIFTALDMFYASFALLQKRQYAKLLILVPFQRLFYRAMMFYVIIKSYVKAIEGTYAMWNKVSRSGQAQLLFDEQKSNLEVGLIGRS